MSPERIAQLRTLDVSYHDYLIASGWEPYENRPETFYCDNYWKKGNKVKRMDAAVLDQARSDLHETVNALDQAYSSLNQFVLAAQQQRTWMEPAQGLRHSPLCNYPSRVNRFCNCGLTDLQQALDDYTQINS